MAKTKKVVSAKKSTEEVKSLQMTVNLHKKLYKIGFKKRAPRAVKEVKEVAQKLMGTDDVRIDTSLNKFLWSKGIGGVPLRVRVQLDRKRNEDEDAANPMYTVVSYIPTADFKGLTTGEPAQE